MVPDYHGNHRRWHAVDLDLLMIAVEGGRPMSGGAFDLQQMIDAMRPMTLRICSTRGGRPGCLVEVFVIDADLGASPMDARPGVESPRTARTSLTWREVGWIDEVEVILKAPRSHGSGEVHAYLADIAWAAGRAASADRGAAGGGPSPEIGFETVLELTSGSVSVRRGEG